MFRNFRLGLVIAAISVFTATAGLTEDASAAPASGIDTSALAAELARVLAFVIIIESAMSALFNWRLYRLLFGGHALRTPIMLLVGWLVVTQFNYDIVARLLHLSLPGAAQPVSNWLSMLLSAFVIAGGSNGIFTIFARLGLRNPLSGAEPPPELDQTQAWIAIHLTGQGAKTAVQVALKDLATTTRPPIAGSVARRTLSEKLADAFGLNHHRFPKTGGRMVKAGTDYEITLIWHAKADGTRTEEVLHVAGVYRFAPRAIVDLYIPVPFTAGPKPPHQGSTE